MGSHDFIVIGAGLGGLSVANFLARFGKRVLVLEKHSLPGGLVTSFARQGTRFDLGIHGLYELNKGQTIPQFLEFWGAPQIETLPCRGDIHCYLNGRAYVFRHGQIVEDFRRAFPLYERDVERVFRVMETIKAEMLADTEAPEPPYDMNLFQLIRFGLRSKRQKPTFMKYGTRDARKVLDEFTDSEELKSAIYSYCPYPIVFMAFAYRWGVFGDNLYPKAGMQAIPDAAVTSLRQMGGELRLGTEVTEILSKDGRVYGVRTKDGDEYHGAVISNASPHYTFSWIKGDSRRVDQMKRAIAARGAFPSACLLFMSLDDSYDLGAAEYIAIVTSEDYKKQPDENTAETAPIAINVYPKRDGDKYRSLVALIPLQYSYKGYWQTEEGRARGEAYRALKGQAEDTILNRIKSQLGDDFIRAISHHELATPITLERYTYSHNGSFMGWSMKERDLGKYMRQRTDLKDLYLVGQWVFPGFGVAGVMASGYYLAKEILKGDGVDLKREFTSHFAHGRN